MFDFKRQAKKLAREIEHINVEYQKAVKMQKDASIKKTMLFKEREEKITSLLALFKLDDSTISSIKASLEKGDVRKINKYLDFPFEWKK